MRDYVRLASGPEPCRPEARYRQVRYLHVLIRDWDVCDNLGADVGH